jgi:hypothetical protein
MVYLEVAAAVVRQMELLQALEQAGLAHLVRVLLVVLVDLLLAHLALAGRAVVRAALVLTGDRLTAAQAVLANHQLSQVQPYFTPEVEAGLLLVQELLELAGHQLAVLAAKLDHQTAQPEQLILVQAAAVDEILAQVLVLEAKV